MKRDNPGRLRERVAFDQPTTSRNATGGEKTGYSEVLRRPAEFIYHRGAEALQDGVLAGTGTFKVRIQQSTPARLVTTDWRMRDVRRSVPYQIREIDAVSDETSIWLVVESGVAT